jgi:hypothetical protein
MIARSQQQHDRTARSATQIPGADMNAMSRVLKFENGGEAVDIPVLVFWPVKEDAAWSARWEIQWPGRPRSNAARGMDGVQALFNALQMIGAELYCSDAHKSGCLSWDKGWAGYGFPVPNNIRDMLMDDDERHV